MDCSRPGFPVHHQLLELAQTHVHQWCHPTILSSVIPFSSCPQSFLASGSFPMSQFFTSGGQGIGASALASVLPMNTQSWFPLWLTGLISLQSKGLSRVFSSTTIQKKEGTYVYLWLIHVDVWQKPTKFCKAIILQLKNKQIKKQKNPTHWSSVKYFCQIQICYFGLIIFPFNRCWRKW